MRRQKIKVLVIANDPLFLQLLTYYLQLEGYDVSPVCDGQQAIEQVAMYAPDLVLLDVASQVPDALPICQRMREHSHAPIVCITAARTEDKGGLLKLGADDYLCRPFDADELLARLRRVLQRRQWSEVQQAHALTQNEKAQIKTIGDLNVDFAHRQVLYAGHEIMLTPREYRLLACLAQYAGRVVSQELLLQCVWGNEYVGKHHLLQVNINRLRRKLEPDPAWPRFLITKSSKDCGVGYLLTCPN